MSAQNNLAVIEIQRETTGLMKPISAMILIATMTAHGAERAIDGLVALYDFDGVEGAAVKDRAGLSPPLDLRITATKNIRRTSGSIEIRKGTVIASTQPPVRLLNALKQSNEITVEVWFKPANLKQDGPARLVTISKDTSQRNFTIGQEAASLQARLRTTRTSKNGMPAIETTRLLSGETTQAVYTRDGTGHATIYVNGKKVNGQTVTGVMSNWDSSYRLALGNELSGERPWLGTLFLVAIYNRDLTAVEVTQNFKAGAQARMDPVKLATAENEQLFESKIAPLLAKHCLECHDPATRNGKLDLSQRATAFAKGDTIVTGKHAASGLWEAVAKNEMPKKREPLSVDEKETIKKWIDGGAKWTLTRIDPAVYTHGGKSHQNSIRRLTLDEYIATVRAATGVNVTKEARAMLPPDLRADGFSNTAYNLNVDLKHINAYSQLARHVVSQMNVTSFSKRFSIKRSFTDKDMRAFIEKLGRWILRGPLEEREIVQYRGITTTVVANGGDFDKAVELVLESMLQSPRFIYRMENQQSSGQVNNHELAVRVSYLIWGAPPDKALNDAADKGELGDASKLQSHVQRMLKDPRAVGRSVQFLSEWLNLDHLDNLRPNKKKFPDWTSGLAADMRLETIEYFKEVVWKQNRPLSDLFNTQLTFLTPALAKHYGLPVSQNGEGLLRYDLAKIPARGGLLTQGSVLTRSGDEASMVTRGLFIMHDLLRGVVKDPPPCVDTTPVPSKPGLTQRSMAEKRIANKKCGGCHEKFEPLAFGLEKFDGLGSFFNKDSHGNALRDDGTILIPGEARPITYRNSAELMKLIANNDRVGHSITWKLAQFAMGRPLGAREVRVVDKIHQSAQKNGGTYSSLITAIALSDLLRTEHTDNVE